MQTDNPDPINQAEEILTSFYDEPLPSADLILRDFAMFSAGIDLKTGTDVTVDDYFKEVGDRFKDIKKNLDNYEIPRTYHVIVSLAHDVAQFYEYGDDRLQELCQELKLHQLGWAELPVELLKHAPGIIQDFIDDHIETVRGEFDNLEPPDSAAMASALERELEQAYSANIELELSDLIYNEHAGTSSRESNEGKLSEAEIMNEKIRVFREQPDDVVQTMRNKIIAQKGDEIREQSRQEAEDKVKMIINRFPAERAFIYALAQFKSTLEKVAEKIKDMPPPERKRGLNLGG